MIDNILFPVDFSASCIAIAPHVKRTAEIFGARVALINVVDPASHNGFELFVRSPREIAAERESIAWHKLITFLNSEFPPAKCSRFLWAGDPAVQIADVASQGDFDLIIMPTHAGLSHQILLGCTTAKVLDLADCPVLTTEHAETIVPNGLTHQQWVCGLDLGPGSKRALFVAGRAAAQAGARLVLVHVIASGDRDSVQWDDDEQIASDECKQARGLLDNLRNAVGCEAIVKVVKGSVKGALIDAARNFDANMLIIGRSTRSGAVRGLRGLMYNLARDSPCLVLSV
jgi:nucleotide-binding universal stress UspA family protein